MRCILLPRRSLSGVMLATLLGGGCAEAVPVASEQAEGQALISTDRQGADVLLQRSSAQLTGWQQDGLVTLQLPRRELAEASLALHDELDRCAGFALEDSDVVSPFELLRTASTRALQVDYTVDNASTVAALLEPLAESNLRATIQGLADFPTRFHESDEGKEASLWIRDRWQAYAGGRADTTVELIEHQKTPQPSISLTIRGSQSPDELVVLGGHMDSINLNGGLAPGADDNASGIAVLDEVIRSAMSLDYRPARTVVFYAYAAEEIGLVGSAEIANEAAEQDLAIAGVLQLDMTNYNPAPSPYLAIVTDYTDEGLNEYARTLIETYVKLPWRDTECGYACSDHGSWQKRGFPVHYVHEARTSESNDEIHTTKDTLALSNGSAQHSLYFAQYSAAFMAELAKGDVAECDAARPCPTGSSCTERKCMVMPSVGGSGGAGGGGGGGMAGMAGALAGSGGSVGGTGGDGPSGMAGTVAIGGMPVAVVAGSSNIALTPSSESESGCACRSTATHSQTTPWAWLALAAGASALRRKRRSI